jgi:hypothetical protein
MPAADFRSIQYLTLRFIDLHLQCHDFRHAIFSLMEKWNHEFIMSKSTIVKKPTQTDGNNLISEKYTKLLN